MSSPIFKISDASLRSNPQQHHDDALPEVCVSFAGVGFYPREMIWTLFDATRKDSWNFQFFFDVLSPDLLCSMKRVLVHYAETRSFSYTRNCFSSFKAFAAFIRGQTPTARISSVRTIDIVNFRSHLGSKREWKLGILAGFFLKWDQMGYPGIDPDALAFLREIRLPGNRKGEAVLTMDPQKGPFTAIELQAIHSAANNAFAAGDISIREYVLVWLFMALGARAVQFSLLKVRDLTVEYASDGSRSYILDVPRGKMQGRRARYNFKRRSLIPELGRLIETLIGEVKRDALCLPLHRIDEPLDLPLFPQWNSDAPPGFDHHPTSSNLSQELKRILDKIPITSERTGQQIAITSRRFRTTLGTRAAQEGHGEFVIAELLDHTDTQQVSVYTKTTPEIIERIDKAVAMQLAPLAQAFAGMIVFDETDAERGDDPTSRIADPQFGCGTGTCGKYGFCSALAPIACYTCRSFQAWLDGPHEMMLDHLIAERNRLMEITGDERIAHANDRTIAAVAQVVLKCREIKDDNTDE